MKSMIKFAAVASLSLGVLAACSDDETTTTSTPTTTSAGGAGGSTTSAGGAGGSENPAPPALGTPVDRMGRPAINTVGSKTFGGPMASDPAKDAYNQNHNAASWGMKHGADIAGAIAILDALDKADTNNADTRGCGNQPLAGGKTEMGSYSGLAGALADDRIRVDLASGACGVYLGVELNALGAFPNMTCGGRTPIDDVIDTSYSALAGGISLFNAMGQPLFGDGIAVRPALKTAYMAGFPFLDATH